MKTAVLDFDDLCDTNDPYDALVKLHDRDSGFKVTLFAIPARCSDTLFAKYDSIRDWCQLGIHGWRHSRHECLGWTSEETQDKVKMALTRYSGFAPVFRAPQWAISTEVYKGLQDGGISVADHMMNIEILPADMPHYIYNLKLREDSLLRLHGHIQDWQGTGLTEDADDATGINAAYLLPIGTPYAFISEVVGERKEVAV